MALGSVVLTAMAIGQLYALHLEGRYRDLESLRVGLRALVTEVEYARKPLPKAWSEVAETYDGACADLFQCASERFGSGDISTAGQAWEEALKHCSERLHLTPEDFRILDSLSGILGISSGENQIFHLQAVDERLEQQMSRAKEDSVKRGKLSRSLGLLGGILIAILLV